ncbi:MAG: M20/M25/M40 family metallo-hydrolase, partial [Microvirga sp.]
SGDGTAYVPPPEALRTLRNSGSASVAARLQGVDLGLNDAPLRPSTSGCEPEDFAGFAPGAIALVRRGTCPFQRKVDLAREAGASGLVVMNQGIDGQTGRFAGQLAGPAAIPVLGVTTEVGRRLAAIAGAAPDTVVHLKVDAETALRTTHNVIAQLGAVEGGYTLVGAHLDSVPEGPGINDNASGTAAILEAALRQARARRPGPAVRFAFWGAEERGLVGSRHHLDALSDEERRRIDLYVNLDMVGSPNFGRFVQLTQEGRAGPVGRAFEAVSRSFADHGLAVEERLGRGRGYGSDDAAFAARGIPTIGLFTGAGGMKSEAQARLFGGTAAQPFDPCYHKACDTSGNIDATVLDAMTDALNAALDRLAPP